MTQIHCLSKNPHALILVSINVKTVETHECLEDSNYRLWWEHVSTTPGGQSTLLASTVSPQTLTGTLRLVMLADSWRGCAVCHTHQRLLRFTIEVPMVDYQNS